MLKNKYNFLVVSVLSILVATLLIVVFLTDGWVVFADQRFVNSVNNDKDRINSTASIDDDFADDSVLVVLDGEISKANKLHKASYFKGVDVDHIEDLTIRQNAVMQNENDFRQILQIYLKNGSKEKVLDSIKKLKNINGVCSAEPNYYAQPANVPDDYYYCNNSQWNLNGTGGINIEGAWNYTKGSKDVRVGIIDSGIANHTDLDNNVVVGYDFYNKNTITNDDSLGHGTLVAGIIGAQGNNAEGIAGINWDVSLVPMQCSYYRSDNTIASDNSSVVRAINKAVDLWGTSEQIDILNYSVSGFGCSFTVFYAVMTYPGLFVWAAGNEGYNVDLFTNIDEYNLSNVISVGAIDKNNERSVWSIDSSSNYGSNVNIFAPGGSGVSSIVPGEKIPSTDNNNGYRGFGGTSCATPHVTGVAALMLSLNPTLTASELKNILLESSDSINITVPTSSGGTAIQTVKKLNASKAVKNSHTTHSYDSKFVYVNGEYHKSYCICGESILSSHWAYSGTGGRYVMCEDCHRLIDTYKYPILIIYGSNDAEKSLRNNLISDNTQLVTYLDLAQVETVLSIYEKNVIIDYYDEKFFTKYSIMYGGTDINKFSYWLLQNAAGTFPE